MNKEYKVTAGLNRIQASRKCEIKFFVEEDLYSLRKWNDAELSITVKESAEHSWECRVSVEEHGGVPVLVYQDKMPQGVQKTCRELLKQFGYKWRKVTYLELASGAVIRNYDELQDVMAYVAQGREWRQKWYYARVAFENITKDFHYKVWETHDHVHASDYEQVYQNTIDAIDFYTKKKTVEGA